MVVLCGWSLASCGDDDPIENNNTENNSGGNNNEDNNNGDGKIDAPMELFGAWQSRGSIYVFKDDGTGKIYSGWDYADDTAESITDFTYSFNSQSSTLTFMGTDFTIAFKNGNTKMDWSIDDIVVMVFYTYEGELPDIKQGPSVPTGITSIVDGNSISVSWEYVSDADSYNVYRSSSAEGGYSLLGTTSYTSYKDNSPLSGYNYYKVSAVNNKGTSSLSSYTSCNYTSTGNVLSSPTGLNAQVNGSSVYVTWQSVNNATSYNIYRSSNANTSYTKIGTSSSTSYTDNNPLSGYNYYKVSAVNSNGESTQSNYVYCEYSENSGPTTLSAPTNVRVANEGNNYVPNVIVRWDAVSGAKTYKVYKSSSANGSYSLMEEVDAYYPSCVDQNPPTSGSRYYKVKAVNGSTESPYSDYAVYTPVNKDDAFEPSFTWGNCTVNGNNMTLRWTYNSGDHIGKPTKVTLRVYNPYAEEWQDTELSKTATSTTFNFAIRTDNDGFFKAAIVAENAAGKCLHIIMYNYKTKEWYKY